MKKDDVKSLILISAFFGGIFWWFNFGNKLIFKNENFEAYISIYRGHGLFSFETCYLLLLVASALVYPMVLWAVLCFGFFDRQLIKEAFQSKKSIFIWLAPLTFLLFIMFMIVIRILVSLAIWLAIFIVILLLAGYLFRDSTRRIIDVARSIFVRR